MACDKRARVTARDTRLVNPSCPARRTESRDTDPVCLGQPNLTRHTSSFRSLPVAFPSSKCTASNGGRPSKTAPPMPENVNVSLPVSRKPEASAVADAPDMPSRTPSAKQGFKRRRATLTLRKQMAVSPGIPHAHRVIPRYRRAGPAHGLLNCICVGWLRCSSSTPKHQKQTCGLQYGNFFVSCCLQYYPQLGAISLPHSKRGARREYSFSIH